MIALGVGVRQFQVFALFWAVGVVVAVVYLLGYKLFGGKLYSLMFDLCFCSLACCVLFVLNLAFNNGEARLFVLVGFLLGIATGWLFFKKPLDKARNVLYNLFNTQKGDTDDNAHLPSKIHIGTGGGGNFAVGSSSVRAVDNVDADGFHGKTR